MPIADIDKTSSTDCQENADTIIKRANEKKQDVSIVDITVTYHYPDPKGLNPTVAMLLASLTALGDLRYRQTQPDGEHTFHVLRKPRLTPS